MKTGSVGNDCPIHQEQLVGVDLNPPGDEIYRHCCVKCVQNKNPSSRILIYSDAQKYVQNQKKAFLFDKETQFQQNKELMRKLGTNILAIKNEYNQLLDQLADYIKFQMIQSEQDLIQLQKKIEDLDLDSYLSNENEFAQPQNNMRGLKRRFEAKLLEILSLNLFAQSQEIVGVLDVRDIQLNPKKPIEIKQQNQEEMESKIKFAYNLNFQCPLHNSEIRMFDLKENISKENRLACEDCITNKQGQYLKLSKAYEQWEEYQSEQCSLLNQSLLKVNSQIQPLIILLNKYEDEHQSRIRKQVLELSKLKDQLQQQKEQKIQQQKRNWQQLAYLEVLDIADALSQPNFIEISKQQIEKENQQSYLTIKSIIKRITDEKKKIESDFRNQLNQISDYFQPKICSEVLNIAVNRPLVLANQQETRQSIEDDSEAITNDLVPQRVCQVHNEDCIAIDINPDCEEEKRHCCAICLLTKTQNQQIKTYKEAQLYLCKTKTKFKEAKESQLKLNFDILKKLQQNILKTRGHYNQVFDTLGNLIRQQINSIEKDRCQLENKLSQIHLDSFLSRKNEFANSDDNINRFKQFSGKMLDEIRADRKLGEFERELNLYNSKSINLTPETFRQEKQLNSQEQIAQIDKSSNIFCPEHNKEIIMFDLNQNTQYENRMLCVTCLTYRKGDFKLLKEVEQLWVKFTDQYSCFWYENYKETLAQIDPLIKLMQIYEEEVSNRIRKYIISVQLKIHQTYDVQELQISGLSQLSEWSKLNFKQIQEILDILIQPDYILRIQQNQMNELNALYDFTEKELQDLLEAKANAEDFFSQNLNELSFDCNTDKSGEDQDKYKQISQGPNNKNESCGAIALSLDEKILLAGCRHLINVYKFDQGKINLKQKLEKHQAEIIKLCFMIPSKQFASIDEISVLAIWNLVQNNWILEQSINAVHENQVQCLLYHIYNEQIITGSFDKDIKFFTKLSKWGVSQTLQIHEGSVLDMNLNVQQNKLVSCGSVKPGFFFRSEGQLIISEQTKGTQWQAIQKIKSDLKINRVCFVGNNKIIYQTPKYLILLAQNSKKVFEGQKKIFNVNDDTIIFPLAFSMSKRWLIFKNTNTISVINFQENGECQYKQMIIAESNYFIGTLSDDGQYLILWDPKSKLLQVRRSQ